MTKEDRAKRSADWFKVVLHFIFGALFGAVLGFVVWELLPVEWSDRNASSALAAFALCGAALGGLSAAVFLDAFRQWFADRL